jgi:hypothetical protein
MKNKTTHIQKFKEFHKYKHTEFSETELLEMAKLTPVDTGISSVHMWIGPNPGYHWKRVKICNIPNKFSEDNTFTLTIPDFEIIGNVNSKLITSKVLNKIQSWITMNMKNILAYSEKGSNMSTSEFLSKLIPVK